MNRPIKILFIAFACEPERGSEPGIGWNCVWHASRSRPVWVLTEKTRQHKIEAYLQTKGEHNINFVYHTLPGWCQWMWKSSFTLNLYYYLWHKQAEKIALRLHNQRQFDVVHHISYVRYWMPSAGAALDIPFVWGPVGGGESVPKGFLRGSRVRDVITEWVRVVMRWAFERDPRLCRCAKRANIAIACSHESAMRMKRLGVKDLRVMSCIGTSGDVAAAARKRRDGEKTRFISVGRLLYWKGFDLGLRAFAKAAIPNSEYVVVGDGPDMARLRQLAVDLVISDVVTFKGALPWRQSLIEFQNADVLVHPSLHDSGGFVLLEAMELEIPVLCLDIGGPALHVNSDTGFAIPAHSPPQAIHDFADAMTRLAGDSALRERLGRAGRDRARADFSWSAKAGAFEKMYLEILEANAAPDEPAANS